MSPKNEYLSIFWLSLLLLFNLIFGAWVNLIGDEAYYWMYAQNLDWGYFDHPPMIALWIKIGYTLIPNTLGTRLLPILFNILGLYLLLKLIQKIQEDKQLQQTNHPSIFLYFSLVICSILYQIYGFIATPDSPLLFFTIAFLFAYYKHLKNTSISTVLLVGMTGAALLYSKYHGILVIGFILLSNLSLWKKQSTYWAGLVTLLLLTPHLYWQYSHDYPSVLYHLTERHRVDYQYSFTLQYLVNQALLYLPFIILAISKWRTPNEASISQINQDVELVNTFYRACYFLVFGVLIFFCMMTFKGRVEDHWTAIACIPLIILVMDWIIGKPKLQKHLKYISLTLLPLFILARIFMAVDIIPNKAIKKRFFRGATWAKGIQQAAAGQTVAFINSYDQAARYAFYTEEESHSLNNRYWRKNQYDLWNYDKLMDGRNIFLITTEAKQHYQAIDVGEKKPFYGRMYNNLTLYPRLQIQFKDTLAQTDQSQLNIPVKLYHEYDQVINLDQKHIFFTVHFMQENKIFAETNAVQVAELVDKAVFSLPPKQEILLHLTVELPEAVKNQSNTTTIIGISLTTMDIGPIRHRGL